MKKGPSASAGTALALIMLGTGCELVDTAVVTGRIDLKGNMLAVGGLVEKAKAAIANNR